MAVARGAPSLAADLLERAAGMAGPADAHRLLFEAAAARLRGGDASGAAGLLGELLGRVPTGPDRARLLLALGEIVYLERPPEALALFVEALEHARGEPTLEATVHLYVAIMGDADPNVGERSARAAVEILERPGVDPDPESAWPARCSNGHSSG